MIKNMSFENEQLKLIFMNGSEYTLNGEELRILRDLLAPGESNRMCGNTWRPNKDVESSGSEISNQRTGRGIL